ncbi:Wzz/FepE/Etk N-terminal domain-containing protein [Pseudoalteromonas viridis]|uniref:Polysaccharide chain length determinant N-terminal domain-containing protein n=1 Tax=Pseudoalteromonas viridis TaxID=339617 RepID=A0ABX7V8W0_9GAMM|nr:Wzz/FepE/Etk N-terminal domain-containing protein [Pseudoalteromonas viridis]QTL36102.1 hypothetical protein J5X90_03370 [Pseudoalteromonas viridis]
MIEQNDIDLRKLIDALLSNKLWVFSLLSIFLVIGFFFATSLPNKYTAETLLSSGTSDISGGGGLSQLSSLAGISLPESGKEKKVAAALKLLESNHFIGGFLSRYQYQADVFAVDSWDPDTNTLSYNPEIYVNGEWIRESGLLTTSEPNDRELAEVFLKDNLSIDYDKASGFLNLYMTHHSPYIAKEMLEKLVFYINLKASERAVSDSEEKIAYLNSAISNSESSELKSAFFSMIVFEEKEKMLASVKQDYLFKVLDPAMLPSAKSGPKRLLILILFAFMGLFFGCLVAFYRGFFMSKSNS